MGRKPLLWTYSVPDSNYKEVKFGFDDPIDTSNGIGRVAFTNKIGHVALTAEATISGEIFRNGAAWSINNESGAWGNMGDVHGKTNMLRDVALFMSSYCGIIVSHQKAYSSNATKRFIQQRYR